MKLYTNTFDLAKASPHRFWVAPYSDFKIGIKILAKGEVIDKDFTVKAGAVELTPDEDKIDGFTLYTLKSGDTGFVEYTIEVEDIAEKLKLTQIVTDSTVFEVGGGGGDVPADVATQTWVNSQISDFITDDALTAYATKDELTGYVENGDLTAYYTKSETSSATELADAFAGSGASSYSILTVQLEDGKYSLQNHAVNNITIFSGTTSALMEFPLSSAGTARDFFVRLNVEDATGLSVYWQEPDGSTPSFDATNDSWNDIQTGVNVMMFMETAQ